MRGPWDLRGLEVFKHLTRAVTYQRGTDSVESAATIGRTEFLVELCIECGTCEQNCPTGAVIFVEPDEPVA